MNQKPMTPELTDAIDTLKSITDPHEAEICGLWLWVKFTSKPGDDTRTTLKSNGFRWARRKEKWYYAGAPSRGKKSMSMQYIRTKYGSEDLDD